MDAAALEAAIQRHRRRARRQPDRSDHGRAAQAPRRPVRRQAGQRAHQEARSGPPWPSRIVRRARNGRSCPTPRATTRGRRCTCGRRSSARCAWCRRRGSNHSWHVPLYVTVRGLTTSPIPYGGRTLELEFDFVGAPPACCARDDGARARGGAGRAAGGDVLRRGHGSVSPSWACRCTCTRRRTRWPTRCRSSATPLRAATIREQATRLWRALLQIDRVLKEFRAHFIGKCSPVHFFWGSFDLAVTRFSGREAPPHPGGVPNFPDWVAREAYSHEVSSAASGRAAAPSTYPAFYSYAYPAPAGFASARGRAGRRVVRDGARRVRAALRRRAHQRVAG